jgi:hypothetical protein
MVPLYTARIEHLGPGDFVRVLCLACGHDELLPHDRLRIRGLPIASNTLIVDLERWFRCRECDARKAAVSIRWAAS